MIYSSILITYENSTCLQDRNNINKICDVRALTLSASFNHSSGFSTQYTVQVNPEKSYILPS